MSIQSFMGIVFNIYKLNMCYMNDFDHRCVFSYWIDYCVYD